MANDNNRSDEPLRVRVANAIYDSRVKSAREQVASHEIDFPRLRRVFKTAFDESDRSVAVLIFSLAEDLMIEGLRKHLNPGVFGGWKAVTDGNGTLATANDRLTVLQLLFWIRDTTCADLRLLKSIRNRFAHHVEVESFEDSRIKGWISTLSPQESPALTLFEEKERADWRKLTSREIYFMRATMTVLQLVHDLAIGPIARFERVAPGDLEGDWDTAPENLKETKRLAADVILWCLPPR